MGIFSNNCCNHLLGHYLGFSIPQSYFLFFKGLMNIENHCRIGFVITNDQILKTTGFGIVDICQQNHFYIIINEKTDIIYAWNDWFTGFPDLTISKIFSSHITLNQNIHILLCGFFSIASSITLTDGSSSDISLCLEECSFFDCHSNSSGGAIYIKHGTHFVLNKVCADQCNTSSNMNGQFCYIYLKSGSQYKNIVHLLSVCKCAQYENTDRNYLFYFYYGNISLNKVNSSINRCAKFSIVCIVDPSVSYTTQSTFTNNTVDNTGCIGFFGNSHDMPQCNIIRNHQKTTDWWGIIYNSASATTTLSDCIIDMNTGATKIIYVMSGSVTLHHCYLQSNMQTSGSVCFQSPLSDSHSLILNHFDSQMCNSVIQHLIDDVNAMTSIIKSIEDTNMFDFPLISTVFIIISI